MYQQICRLARLALALVGLHFALPVYADGGSAQTNQDIDLFLVNPAVAADRPNVLIIWDNTANWGQQVIGQTAYSIERQALAQAISALSDEFNVGLMLFTESGNGTPKGSPATMRALWASAEGIKHRRGTEGEQV